MWKPRWLLALPLALAATAAPVTARASTIRDDAEMFNADAVRQAQAALNRVEREYRVPVTVETVSTLDGRDIAEVSKERAERSTPGLYILIAKKEHKIYDRVYGTFKNAINPSRQAAIRRGFEGPFKKGDYDAGLTAGVSAIDSELSSARLETGGNLAQPPAAARVPGRAGFPARRGNPQAGFGLGSLLTLGIVIIGVLFVFRLIGSLFGGRGGYAGQPGRMGAPGYGGGGGGGFMSSLFGGIGGAMAGNWLYDQFSGRHQGGGYTDSSTYGGESDASAGGGSDWSSGGGGDWGGGDAGGGGGDWGGGGGDTGGGGDW